MASSLQKHLQVVKALKAKSANKAVNSPVITNSSTAKSIRSDSLGIVKIAVHRYLENWEKNKSMNIQSTKELKDLIGVFTVITEGTQNQNKDAPQLNVQALNFYAHQFREPNTVKNVNKGINKKLKKLGPKDAEKLLKDQQNQLNNDNEKHM